MGEDKLIDQSELAESVAEKIKYEFFDHFLVKPLDPVKVKKEVSKLPDKKPVKDENGIEAVDVDEVKTEVKEVDSDYRRGVVLKLPMSYTKMQDDPEQSKYIWTQVKVGSIVLFRETAGLRFDLLKDSRLIRQYDIVGIENND